MRRTILAATAALLLGASGCSGSAGEDGSSTDAPSTAVATTGTEPGTDLDLGEAAVLVWQPTTDLTGELELSVEAVAEQRRSVFDGWVGGDVMATSRPYFVTVSLANVGASDLGGRQVPLYLRDDSDRLGSPWTLDGDFTACQSGPLPSPFAPGDEAEMCLVYLVPDGARIRDLVFEPTEGYEPITWTGPVDEPAEPGRTGRGKGG